MNTLTESQQLQLELQRAQLREALARLTMEIRHFINTGKGRVFLLDALKDADTLLAASGTTEPAPAPAADPGYRLMPHASSLALAHRVFGIQATAAPEATQTDRRGV